MLYIGLDIGTTGSKATAINLDGEVKAFSTCEYATVRTNPGWAEIQPELVWQAVEKIIQEVATKAREPIDAIAITSLGESFILLDKNDRVLSNSMLFADIWGTEEIDDILGKIDAQRLFDLTGMPINSMYSLNKWLWLKKHMTGILDRTEKVFFFADFIGYMLSGCRCVDYSLASRTLLFDHRKRNWSAPILGLFNIQASFLSEPVSSGTVIGKVSPHIAEALGLRKDTRIVAGGHDQVCAALGAGVLKYGQCVDGIGTSECITTMISNSSDPQFMRENNYCMERPGRQICYFGIQYHRRLGAALVQGYF